MGLQVRVRHTLGARLVELEPKGMIRVGQAAECELAVPSSTVAAVHCGLYVKGDQWFVRPASSKLVLLVNDQPVTEPTAVNPGDVITLGKGGQAPTIELDPLGVARRTQAASRPSRRPAVPAPRAASAPAEELPPPPPPAPPQMPPNPPQFTPEAPVAHDEHWHLEGVTTAAPPAVRRRSRPRKKSGIGIGLVLAWGVGIGAAFGVLVVFVVQKQKETGAIKAPQPYTRIIEVPGPGSEAAATGGTAPVATVGGEKGAAPAGTGAAVGKKAPAAKGSPAAKATAQGAGTSGPVTVIIEQPTTQDTTIFNFNQGMPKEAPVIPRGAGSPDSMTSKPDKPAEPPNPLKLEDAWRTVEFATKGKDYKETLCVIENYRVLRPGLFADELKGFETAALDRLWWARIKELCDRRDQGTLDIEEMEQQIQDETMPERKEELEKAKKLLVEEKEAAIKQMADETGYSAADAPDVDNEQDITNLRKERSPERFAKWSELVMKSIKEKRLLPWE